MKKLFILLTLVVSVAHGFGSEGVGGGDPDAVDFIVKVKAIASWAQKGRGPFNSDEYRKINSIAKALSEKMNDQSRTPIVMVEEDLFDASGAAKVALYDKHAFKIMVTRAKWWNLKEEDKFVTAALELFGLAEVQDRYGVAGLLRTDMVYLKSIDVNPPENQFISRWRNATKSEVGFFEGRDNSNRVCSVALEDGKSWAHGKSPRVGNIKFADIKVNRFILKDVTRGFGKVPASSYEYSLNGKNEKIWKQVDDNYNRSIFFDGWSIRKTERISVVIDLQRERKFEVVAGKKSFVCSNVKKLSNAEYISKTLPNLDVLYKNLSQEVEKSCAVYKCDDAENEYMRQLGYFLSQTKQRLKAGDDKGATESLILFVAKIIEGREDIDAPSEPTFNTLMGYAMSQIELLLHLEY